MYKNTKKDRTTAKVRPRKETTRLKTEPTVDELRNIHQNEQIKKEEEQTAKDKSEEQEPKNKEGNRPNLKDNKNVGEEQKEKRQQKTLDTRNKKRLEETALRRGQGSSDVEMKVSDKDVQDQNKMLQQGIDNRQEGVNYTLHKIDQKYVNNLMKGDGERGDINAQDVKTYFERVSKGYPDWIRGQAKSVVLIHKESGKFKMIRSNAQLKGTDKKDLSGYEGITIPLALFKKLTGSK